MLCQAEFHKYDRDGNGYLDRGELQGALKSLKPEAADSALELVVGILLKTDNDGKLDLEEFLASYNQMVDILNAMGDSDVTPSEKQARRVPRCSDAMHRRDAATPSLAAHTTRPRTDAPTT
jgi:hypothetical protein